MEEKELWGVTKTTKISNAYWRSLKSSATHKNWLNKNHDRWVGVGGTFAASFTDKGEARKALNKKLSFEITYWGLDHVGRWDYKVEKIGK